MERQLVDFISNYTEQCKLIWRHRNKRGCLTQKSWHKCRMSTFGLQSDTMLMKSRILVFGATDTTSGALSRILSLLSQHPDVQEKLRTEIINARGDRDAIPYDELSELPYLDAICRETLRLYVPINSEKMH